jgi:hypothetical protein
LGAANHDRIQWFGKVFQGDSSLTLGFGFAHPVGMDDLESFHSFIIFVKTNTTLKTLPIYLLISKALRQGGEEGRV